MASRTIFNKENDFTLKDYMRRYCTSNRVVLADNFHLEIIGFRPRCLGIHLSRNQIGDHLNRQGRM